MAKTYLRFIHKKCFGVVASQKATALLDKSGKLAITGALENVIIWNIKTGASIATLYDRNVEVKKHGEVTVLVLSPDGKFIGAGYSNGVIRVWDFMKRSLAIEFKGHQKAISALTFDVDGVSLYSGSLDTHVVMWDIVAETGRVRLKGHKNAVTDIVCLSKSMIVTASKDTLMKVWDLETQHCIQTVVGHRSEVWSIDCDSLSNPRYMITGSADAALRVWQIDASAPRKTTELEPHVARMPLQALVVKEETGMVEGADGEVLNITSHNESDAVKLWGSMGRQGSGRISRLRYGMNGKVVAVACAGKSIELYAVRSEADINKKVSRRRKRSREKARKEGKSEEDIEQEALSTALDAQPSDMLELLTVIRTDHKITGFDFMGNSSGKMSGSKGAEEDVISEDINIIVSLANNSIEQYTVLVKEGQAAGTSEKTKTSTLAAAGHRSDVRSVALSSDDSMVLSTSASSTKIWNSRTQECIRTIETGFVLCGAFCPGDRHIVIGTKKGQLQIIDIASSEAIYNNEEAHGGAVWSLALRPDGRGIVTGSADKEVKFWDFELSSSEEGGFKRLSLVHTRTLKMSDDVLCVKLSHTKDTTKLLLAVSLLDCTVKIFHEDTLKFFLSLYGHKLPVMDMDISTDNTLIATASADKNVKLWGLDFGDCHKSLFAHGDSVMAVKFVPNTHYFFTAGKDCLIKYWDGDKFEQILTLDSHWGEVWSLAISSLGDFIVSGSHDRSIRLWERTEEQVFVDEERERELEDIFEADLDAPVFDHGAKGDGKETGAAGQRSMSTVRSAEALIEAMQLSEEEQEIIVEHNRATAVAEAALSAKERKARAEDPANAKPLVARPAPNVILLGRSPVQHVLVTLQSIKPSDLEQALLVIPFDAVVRLFGYLEALSSSGEQVELVSKCIFFLLKVHHRAIVSNRILLEVLDRLKVNTRKQLMKHRDRMGFNLAAMKYVRLQMAKGDGRFFGEEEEKPTSTAVVASYEKPSKRRKLG